MKISNETMNKYNRTLVDYEDFIEPSKEKAEDIYYFIFECCNAYSRRYKVPIKKVVQEFKEYKMYEYMFECYDYLHLLSINENIVDFRSRVKSSIKYN